MTVWRVSVKRPNKTKAAAHTVQAMTRARSRFTDRELWLSRASIGRSRATLSPPRQDEDAIRGDAFDQARDDAAARPTCFLADDVGERVEGALKENMVGGCGEEQAQQRRLEPESADDDQQCHHSVDQSEPQPSARAPGPDPHGAAEGCP